MYRLVSAEIQGYKRVRLINLAFDKKKNMLILAGKNAQGKSSAIDGLWSALQNRVVNTEEPIRRGEDKAIVKLDLGDITVTRTWTAKGSKLLVENKAGTVIKSPQAVLDSLVGNLSFDPLAFTMMKSREQKALLQELVGLDFSDLEEEREALYDDRTGVGRDLTRVKGAYELMSIPEGEIPKEELSVSKLMEELQKAEDFNRWVDEKQAERDKKIENLDLCKTHLTDLENERVKLLEQIKVLDGRIEKGNETISNAEKEIATFEAQAFPEKQPVDGIKDQIRQADEINQKVRQNKARLEAQAEVDSYREEYNEFTEKIQEIDNEKSRRLRAVTMPVEGLGLDDNGVTFNGLPFSQASSAEQLRVSVALAVAANPKLRIACVKTGAFLDDDSLADLARLADEMGIQIIVERVGKNDKGAVIIEDGEILEEVAS